MRTHTPFQLVWVLLGLFLVSCDTFAPNEAMKLSRELGLAPRQIKFWFKNRRTQMKGRSFSSWRKRSELSSSS